jgi:hypothetical protein
MVSAKELLLNATGVKSIQRLLKLKQVTCIKVKNPKKKASVSIPKRLLTKYQIKDKVFAKWKKDVVSYKYSVFYSPRAAKKKKTTKVVTRKANKVVLKSSSKHARKRRIAILDTKLLACMKPKRT